SMASPTLTSREGLAGWPLTVTRPFPISSLESPRVLKKRAAHSHLSSLVPVIRSLRRGPWGAGAPAARSQSSAARSVVSSAGSSAIVAPEAAPLLSVRRGGEACVKTCGTEASISSRASSGGAERPGARLLLLERGGVRGAARIPALEVADRQLR